MLVAEVVPRSHRRRAGRPRLTSSVDHATVRRDDCSRSSSSRSKTPSGCASRGDRVCETTHARRGCRPRRTRRRDGRARPAGVSPRRDARRRRRRRGSTRHKGRGAADRRSAPAQTSPWVTSSLRSCQGSRNECARPRRPMRRSSTCVRDKGVAEPGGAQLGPQTRGRTRPGGEPSASGPSVARSRDFNETRNLSEGHRSRATQRVADPQHRAGTKRRWSWVTAAWYPQETRQGGTQIADRVADLQCVAGDGSSMCPRRPPRHVVEDPSPHASRGGLSSPSHVSSGRACFMIVSAAFNVRCASSRAAFASAAIRAASS